MSEVVSPAVESALEASARWRLLGLLFERPRAGWRREVEALAREIREPRLARAAAAAGSLDEGRYHRLLGPGGAVSPREAAHRPFHDPGQLLAALRGFYETFSYRPVAEDPADHVAVEIGFLGFLALKEAYALSRNDHDAAEETRRAAKLFMEEHLAVLSGALPDKLPGGAAGHLLEAARLLREWCPPRDPQPGPQVPSADPGACDDTSCGGCCP